MKRIGVFSGTFDPIHIGHVEVCLVARAACELDEIVLLIEKSPKRKQGISDYKDRKKMVELATNDFESINLVDVPEDSLSFSKTGKALEQKYKGSTLVLIVGSDMLEHLSDWPGLEDWLATHELCVVLRDNKDQASTKKLLAELEQKHPKLKVKTVPAVWSPVSSSQIKKELAKHGGSERLHRDVVAYIMKHKLYDLSVSK